MKVLGFKKFFVSLGLGALLMFGSAAAVSAATGAVLEQYSEPEEERVILSEEHTVDVPAAYLSSSDTVKAVQTEATTSSITLRWNPVSGASTYEVALGPYQARDDQLFKKFAPIKSTGCKISGADLKPGTPYTVRIRACSSSGNSAYTYTTCFTLYDSIKVDKVSYKNDIFTYSLKPTTKYNFISGYRVSYYGYHTGKTVNKYYAARAGFSIKPAANAFYKVTIRPYVNLNGKKYICPAIATEYMAQQPKLSKKGFTSSTMTIGWNKVAGASSYTVFIKYPGAASYKKVKTTTGLSFKLTGMKQNQDYLVKVIANRGSAHSPSVYYYRMKLIHK